MVIFQIILFLVSAALGIYSLIVTFTQGPSTLVPLIINDLSQMTWNGQFNFDLLCFLALSGFWVAWRRKFSAAGLGFGVAAFILGGSFFLPYFLLLTVLAKGDLQALFFGERSAEIKRTH